MSDASIALFVIVALAIFIIAAMGIRIVRPWEKGKPPQQETVYSVIVR